MAYGIAAVVKCDLSRPGQRVNNPSAREIFVTGMAKAIAKGIF
jgi:hypothetical protein